MTIVRVKRVSRNIPTGLTPRPEEPQAIDFRLVPRPDGVCDESAAETAAPALLMEVVALCEKSNNISRQMGRIMNLPKGEFDQDMAIGLYQRVAVLRASGIVLSGKLARSDINDPGAMSSVAGIITQAKQMLEDMETRLQAG